VITGLMNNPGRPLEAELERVAAEGHAFVDLTLEPPLGWPVDAGALGERVRALGLGVVGHTAAYLPIASPFDAIREAALGAIVAAVEAFAVLGARWVNVHPDRGPRLVPDEDSRDRCADTIARAADAAAPLGVGIMVENLSPPMSTPEWLGPVLDAHPSVGLHLDAGHANIRGPGVGPLLDAFGDRLAHLHVHDNGGYRDEHLPLGAGKVDWPDVARRVRATGYDGTVTIEVFATEEELVRLSTRLWRGWWEAAAD
jgi:sugar phosphate isomerase/epimerase